MKNIIVVLSMFALSSCTTNGYMSVNDQVGVGKVVKAEGSYFEFLNIFGYNENLAHQVKEKLQAECKGPVTGVTTITHATWLIVGTSYGLRAEGVCKGKGGAKGEKGGDKAGEKEASLEGEVPMDMDDSPEMSL